MASTALDSKLIEAPENSSMKNSTFLSLDEASLGLVSGERVTSRETPSSSLIGPGHLNGHCAASLDCAVTEVVATHVIMTAVVQVDGEG